MKADDFEDADRYYQPEPLWQCRQHLHQQRQAYAREFKYSVNAGNIGVNIGVAAPSASFPFGGQKDSFFGDLHGQGMDSIEFYTERKIVIERWV